MSELPPIQLESTRIGLPDRLLSKEEFIQMYVLLRASAVNGGLDGTESLVGTESVVRAKQAWDTMQKSSKENTGTNGEEENEGRMPYPLPIGLIVGFLIILFFIGWKLFAMD